MSYLTWQIDFVARRILVPKKGLIYARIHVHQERKKERKKEEKSPTIFTQALAVLNLPPPQVLTCPHCI